MWQACWRKSTLAKKQPRPRCSLLWFSGLRKNWILVLFPAEASAAGCGLHTEAEHFLSRNRGRLSCVLPDRDKTGQWFDFRCFRPALLGLFRRQSSWYPWTELTSTSRPESGCRSTGQSFFGCCTFWRRYSEGENKNWGKLLYYGTVFGSVVSQSENCSRTRSFWSAQDQPRYSWSWLGWAKAARIPGVSRIHFLPANCFFRCLSISICQETRELELLAQRQLDLFSFLLIINPEK